MDLLIALALGTAQAAAADPLEPSSVSEAADLAARNEAEEAANCAARKFETTIQLTVKGAPKSSKVRLCGKPGQTDADWMRTLKDAATKVEANPKMPASAKKQIVTALNAEIIKLGGTATASAGRPIDFTLGRSRPAQSAEPPAGYSALPPMPTAPARAPAATPAYSSLPALPSGPAARPVSYVAAPLLPKPRLTIRCFNPSDIAGDGPCMGFERETMVTVQADEDLKGATALRFVRDGSPRADVQIAQLRRGRSTRFTLPREVCAGVVGGRLEMQIVRSAPGTPAAAGQVVDSDGPYNLRC